jgi:hypothetical protein
MSNTAPSGLVVIPTQPIGARNRKVTEQIVWQQADLKSFEEMTGSNAVLQNQLQSEVEPEK